MIRLDIFDLWQTFCTEVNVQQNGQVQPFTFQNWLNAISNEIFRDKFDSYEKVQKESDELKLPFLKNVSRPVTLGAGATFGVAAYPSDYGYFSSAMTLRPKDEKACQSREPLPEINADGKCTKYTDPDYAQMAIQHEAENLTTREAQLMDNQRWNSCLNHPKKGPTYNNPRITQYDGGFKIAPAGVQLIILDYLKSPRACYFAYTITTDDILQYDAANSIQLEWPNILKQEFLTRLSKKYAKYIQSPEIYQMAEGDRKVAE